MSEIKPALTPEEWARPMKFNEVAEMVMAAEFHGVAARCLHGQPFGFTREDVDLLRGVAAKFDEPLNPAAIGAVHNPHRDLADRIEALLPPL